MPEILKNKLLALFTRLDEYKKIANECRPCIREFLKNPSMLHGADGRMQMVQICAEMMANGASDDTIAFFAQIVYRDDYKPDVTRDETAGIDPAKPPKCETLGREYPAMTFCEKCTFRGSPTVDESRATLGDQIDPKARMVIPEGHKIPDGFSTTNTTTQFYKKVRDGFEAVTLCGGHVAIIGKGVNIDDENAWLDICFTDAQQGAPKHALLSQRATLSRQGVMALADKGLNLPEGNAAKMNEYYQNIWQKTAPKYHNKS